MLALATAASAASLPRALLAERKRAAAPAVAKKAAMAPEVAMKKAAAPAAAKRAASAVAVEPQADFEVRRRGIQGGAMDGVDL